MRHWQTGVEKETQPPLQEIATHRETSQQNAKTIRRALYIAVFALACLVRFSNIDAHGLWFDEILSVTSANGHALSVPEVAEGQNFTPQEIASHNSLAQVRQAVIWQDNGNAILYCLALHSWIRLFGTSDAAVRSFSMVCGVLIVLLLFQLCRNFFVERVAWWAAGFAALHPLLIRYSQEARAYAFATLLSLGATLLFVKVWQQRGRLNWAYGVLYGLLAGAALLAHYLTAHIFIAHAIAAALFVRGRKAWVQLAAAGVLAVCIFFAWQATGGREGMARINAANANYGRLASASTDGPFVAPFTPRYVVAGLTQTVYTLSGNFLQRTGIKLRALLPMLLLPLCLAVIAWRARQSYQISERGLLFFALMALSGVAFSFVLGAWAGHSISFQVTYANFSAPYFAAILGIGMASAIAGSGWRGWFGKAVALAQAVIVLFSITMVYRDAPWQRPPNPYAAIAAQIAGKVEAGVEVQYPSWEDALLCNLYLAPTTTVVQRVEPAPQNSQAEDYIVVRRGDEPLLTVASPREYWLHFHEQ